MLNSGQRTHYQLGAPPAMELIKGPKCSGTSGTSLKAAQNTPGTDPEVRRAERGSWGFWGGYTDLLPFPPAHIKK